MNKDLFNVIYKMNFKMYDSKTPSPLDANSVHNCLSIQAFFNSMQTDRAKLVFANNAQIEQIKKVAEEAGREVHINTEDLAIIRNLSSKHALIVTDEDLIRGVDYRCSKGLDLLLCTEPSSNRMLIQALGRVTRCDDPGTRYRLAEDKPVSPETMSKV